MNELCTAALADTALVVAPPAVANGSVSLRNATVWQRLAHVGGTPQSADSPERSDDGARHADGVGGIVGGAPQASASSFLQLEFQEEQLEWSALTTYGAAPAPRGGHCVHVSGEEMFVFGGCTFPNPRCFNDVHVLNLASNTWAHVRAEGNAPHPASRVACGSAGLDLVVFGGYAGTYTSAAYVFNVESSSWRYRQTLPPDPSPAPQAGPCSSASSALSLRAEPVGDAPRGRQGASLTRRAGSFILFGGADDVQPYNDVHVLSIDVSSWSTPRVRCAPVRRRHAADPNPAPPSSPPPPLTLADPSGPRPSDFDGPSPAPPAGPQSAFDIGRPK
eukprot:5658853-Prymnesium_polylepis.1